MAERITKLGKALRKRLTDAEQLLWNYLSHPPLNPLPSREGKVTHLK
jgi:very-short-patch-repair endonuclease